MSALPKLTEGNWYNFKVEKSVSIDQEDDFFVLTDPYGTRYLLEKEVYKNYRITEGEQLMCRVDKINCTGKVFLEPKHPHYTEGDIFPFEVVNNQQNRNSVGLTEYFVMVRDAFGYETLVPNPENKNLSGVLLCRVDRIKKGTLFLSLPEAKKTLSGLKEGDWLKMKITGMFTLAGLQEYWILKDAHGNSFQLKKKTYERYGFFIGKEIDGHIVKIKSVFDGIIEPKHPIYSIGEGYSFEIDDKAIDVVEGLDVYYLITSDVYGNKIKVVVTKEQFNSTKTNSLVICVVKKIKNSLLTLELV